MKNLKIFSICAALATTFGTSGAPALAKTSHIVVTAPSDEVVGRHITYADLNLATTQGERTLNRRVAYGVNDLCGEAGGPSDGSFAFKRFMTNCSNTAWDQARPQIALAVERAREIASTGMSAITAAAVTISLPK